jgi:hypothetical protein
MKNGSALWHAGVGWERRDRLGSGEVETVRLSDPERAGLSE